MTLSFPKTVFVQGNRKMPKALVVMALVLRACAGLGWLGSPLVGWENMCG